MEFAARKSKAGAVESFSSRLRDGLRHYVLLRFHEPLPERHKPVVHADLHQVQGWLRRLAQDHFNLQVLRELSYSHVSSTALGTASLDELVRRAAAQLMDGRLRLAEAPVVSLRGLLRTVKKEETFFVGSPGTELEFAL